MRARCSMLWIVAASSFTFGGCGQAPREQPPGAVAEASRQPAAVASDQSVASDQAAPLTGGAPAVASDQPDEMTIVMEACKASRPGKFTGDTGLWTFIVSGTPKDKLVKRGTVSIDGQDYTLYLPKAASYSTTNSGANDSDLENTSTVISVDQNADGKLTADESWFANLPLRLGERMFDVAEIAEDGSQMILRPSKSPLRGVIVGRTCPPFSFGTADGGDVSLEKMAGKAFLLDIWSVT